MSPRPTGQQPGSPCWQRGSEVFWGVPANDILHRNREPPKSLCCKTSFLYSGSSDFHCCSNCYSPSAAFLPTAPPNLDLTTLRINKSQETNNLSSYLLWPCWTRHIFCKFPVVFTPCTIPSLHVDWRAVCVLSTRIISLLSANSPWQWLEFQDASLI